MKIIKQGNYDPNRTKRFECKNCGCIFEADKSEYKDYFQYNQTDYYCECPTCGISVQWKDVNANPYSEWGYNTPCIPK